MKSFSEISRETLTELACHLTDEVAEFAKANGISGMSHAGAWDVYTAVQEAVEKEYDRAQMAKRFRR